MRSVAPAADAGPVNEPSTLPSALSRTTSRGGTPEPPARPTSTLPSPCRASALTEPPSVGLKFASSTPSALKRAIRLRAVPAMLEKSPPTIVRPSGSASSAFTAPSGRGWKAVLTEPPSLRLARLRAGMPPTVVKLPPMRIEPLSWSPVKLPPISTLPSGRAVAASTLPLTSGLKLRSSEPSELMRARLRRATSLVVPAGFSVVNAPPASTAPSD